MEQNDLVRAYHQMIRIIYQTKQVMVVSYIEYDYVLSNIKAIKT